MIRGVKHIIRHPLLILLTSVGVSAQIPSPPYESDTISLPNPPGFEVINKPSGSLVFSFYTTVRYLNQTGLDPTYQFLDGTSVTLDRRQDIQFQKVMLYFKGWLFTPEFRYLTYVWSSNTSLGLGAQVVVGGNLQYQIHPALDIGIGISGLPSTRSLLGQWPFWLRQDARVMSEEFFRASFTTGIWLQGEVTKGLFYKAMLGNNMSQLGIDAGQLDNRLDTFSAGIWYSSDEEERTVIFGDFKGHSKPAFLIGSSFTGSTEDAQNQPDTEAPENSQIRLSDGSILFKPNLLEENSQVQTLYNAMHALYGGVKYKGTSVDFEFYNRWIRLKEIRGNISKSSFRDQGYYLKGSQMILPRFLMLYAFHSKIWGEYGDPWDTGIGLNLYPNRTQNLRVNAELTYAKNSPVGYLSYPLLVGASGPVFMINVELQY